MQKTFQVKTSTIYPLGVQFTSNGLHIAAVFEKKNDCGILLYDKQHKNGIKIPFPEESRKGNIYSMLLEGYQNTDCAYLFYQGNKIFQDSYAKALVNERKYGQISDKLSRCLVMNRSYCWEADKNPMIPFEDSIFYMLHVRGFTKHASSGVKARGTYQGIVEKIPYLKELGITAIVLMPTYEFHEILLPEKRKQPTTMEEAIASYKEPLPAAEEKEALPRINYWGYQEGLYYMPKTGYAASKDAVTEFKDMVKALHQNGIEVIMQFYFPPTVKQITILDILKFWVLEYHVDGFHLMGVDIPFYELCREPLLSETKILGEDDISFSEEKTEERYRNYGFMNNAFYYDIRKFLKGDDNEINHFIYHGRNNGKDKAIVNYIAKQDGFRLADLVSYDRKHNLANHESNQDGSDYNCSWNCGIEGVSRKKAILSLRMRQMKNALTFVFLSQGTPLLYSGDEFGNTQSGNNNPYCQDNAIGWIKWNLQKSNQELLTYTKELIAFRKEHSIFCMKEPLQGIDYLSCGYPDISYHGKEAWRPDTNPANRTIGVLYCEDYGTKKKAGLSNNLLYLGVNMYWESCSLGLPNLPKGKEWTVLFSTQAEGSEKALSVSDGEVDKKEISQSVLVAPRTIVVLGIKDIPEERKDKKQKNKTGIKTESKKEERFIKHE